MDGSCGGSDDCVHSGEGDVTSEEVIVLRQDKLSSDMSATSSWPLETVSISISAVEGNHWVH